LLPIHGMAQAGVECTLGAISLLSFLMDDNSKRPDFQRHLASFRTDTYLILCNSNSDVLSSFVGT
jgi:hypothetical protein